MSSFDGPYLRVLTPKTIDGYNLATIHGMVTYNEQHLPLSAKKHLEAKNRQLPEHLRHKIEIVDAAYAPEQVEVPTVKQIKKK